MAKILVVEDDIVSAEMIRTRLCEKGFQVIIAGTGEEGIKLAQKILPDLILMDMVLPGIHGLEATIRIKANPLTKKIPIFALTILNSPDFIKACYQDGICLFLRKPYDFKELLTQINRYVSRQDSKSKKIMVINDEPSFVKTISSALKDFDYSVISVPDGMVRVDQVHSLNPDLILLDIGMLEDWGIVMFNILKTSNSTMSIPIILMHNQLSPDELEEIKAKLGAEDYISNTTRIKEVVDKIQKICGE
ncbi:MAG: response regulator [Candidatus Aminicenantes bacterium]|nr:response regulator [Candidatus Aminicenantes bacterium]